MLADANIVRTGAHNQSLTQLSYVLARHLCGTPACPPTQAFPLSATAWQKAEMQTSDTAWQFGTAN